MYWRNGSSIKLCVWQSERSAAYTLTPTPSPYPTPYLPAKQSVVYANAMEGLVCFKDRMVGLTWKELPSATYIDGPILKELGNC